MSKRLLFKVLIVTNYDFSLQHSGAQNRVLGLARALSNNGSIKIIHQGPDLRKDEVIFVGYTNWMQKLIGDSAPYTSYLCPDFYRKMKSAIKDVDIVQVEQPYLLLPTILAVRSSTNKPKIVLDEHNVDFQAAKSKINGFSFSSFFALSTLPYIFVSERLAISLSQLILCVSYSDKNQLENFYKVTEEKTFVVPNGVDIVKFRGDSQKSENSFVNNQTVFFHGTLSWFPNLEAANIIVDYLAPKLPKGEFLIAGTDAPMSLLKKIKNTKNVEYIGFQRNLEERIMSSKVCICPVLSGGGTKLKVLEYIASGRPIVATFKAIEGLKMVNGVNGFFHSEVNEEFVKSIKILLSDDQLVERIGRNNRRLSLVFDWNAIGNRLSGKYSDLICQ